MPVTQEDLLAVAEATIEMFKDKYPRLRDKITIEFTRRANGICNETKRRIRMPLRELEGDEGWAVHTMVHELAHIAAPPNSKHNKIYKMIERDMCKPWGIELSNYARAYAKKISYNNQVVYDATKCIPVRREPRWKRWARFPELDAQLKKCKTGADLDDLLEELEKRKLNLYTKRNRNYADGFYHVSDATWTEYYIGDGGDEAMGRISDLYKTLYVDGYGD